MTVPDRLAAVRAPDEREAEQRAWATVREAYRERVPQPRRARRRVRLLLAPALAALAAGVALTPAGATVGRWIGHAFAGPRPARAPFSLPAPGRVLVSGSTGTWLVAADGSRRRLGSWTQASFSPNARYVAVASGDTLAAVNPLGVVEWALHRRAVSDPRWWSPLGLWVAYLSGPTLRVVWGNGENDRLLASHVDRVAPAWRPGFAYQVAYATASGGVVVRSAPTGAVAWRTAPGPRPIELAWSADGTRLLVVARAGARVYDAHGGLVTRIALDRLTPARAGALSPNGRALALVLGGADEAVRYDLSRRPTPVVLFSGAGLGSLAWSPNGRWVLLSWPVADEWIFVRANGSRVLAVSHVAEEFSPRRPGGYPSVDGWCCTTHGG